MDEREKIEEELVGSEGQKEAVEMMVLFTKREHEDGLRRMGEDGMYDVIVEDVQSVWSM